MSAEERIIEKNLEIREATTRYVNITCLDKETKEAFDLSEFTVQTHLSFESNRQYVNTVAAENIISYKIPAEISKGTRKGIAETRIFKDGDVYEVLRINITVKKADKPDLEPNE